MSKDDFWVELEKGYWCVYHVSLEEKPIARFLKKKHAVSFMEKEMQKLGIHE